MPHTFNVGDEITAARLNQSDPETHNRLLNAEYNILELYLENYFSGKQTPFQGLFFDGFSDSTKTELLSNLKDETSGKRLAITEVPIPPLILEYLVIGGGGGGGAPPPDQPGGGGGAGGYRTAAGYSLSLQSVAVTVGSGGAKNTNGQDSIFDTIIAIGGGRGGVKGGTLSGASGGSGGGGALTGSGGAGTGGQGNSGGSGPGGSNSAGGGGGGAGQAGQSASGNNGGNGGNGLASSITGTPVTRGGGGGGDKDVGGTTNGTGGSGGGAAGESNTNGTPNTGGGGGGGNGSFGQGGSGIVIIRFLTADVSGWSYSGTYNTGVDGSYTWIEMTGSGTFQWSSSTTQFATGFYRSIKTTFQVAKKSLKLWVVRNFSARFNLQASIAQGATTLTIAGDQTGKFANGDTIDIYDANNFVRERKTLTATPSFGGGNTTLTFTPSISNASGFGTSAFVERVDVKPQVSLVNFNAADNFQDLTYSKSLVLSGNKNLAKTIIANGTAQIDTAQFKFGGSSLLISPTSASNKLTIPDSDDWTFFGGDFTIDLWVRFSSLPHDGSFQNLVSQTDENWNGASLGHSWGLFQRDSAAVGSRVLFLRQTDSGADTVNIGCLFDPNLNQWYYLAVTKKGSTFRIFIDGVAQPLTFNTFTTPVNINGQLRVGAGSLGSSTIDGAGNYSAWIDDLRIEKGSALWTNNFTPPMSAVSPDEETVLLLHCDGADASTTFIDTPAVFVGVEDEYTFNNATAEEDFKAKLLLSRQDTSLNVYAKRLGVSLTDT